MPSIFGNGRAATDILHRRDKIFRFSDLPRELRNNIYEMLLDQEQILVNKFGVRAIMLNRPNKHLPFLGQLFQTELEEQALSSHCLYIEGDIVGYPLLGNGALKSRPSAKVRFVTIYRIIGSGLAADVQTPGPPTTDALVDIEEYKPLWKHFLNKLPQLTGSRQVAVDLHLRMSRTPPKRVIAKIRTDFTILTKGCRFNAFNIYFQLDETLERQWRPWKSNFHREDDKLIIHYSGETESFELVEMDDTIEQLFPNAGQR